MSIQNFLQFLSLLLSKCAEKVYNKQQHKKLKKMPLIIKSRAGFPFKFNEQKAIQAVAFLLKQKHEPAKIDNYMRLLKLLYFADRESIRETGRPITGDRFVAMEHGPTLSKLYDLVLQRILNNTEWDKYIERIGYEIRLIQDPGNSKLCRYEIDLLRRIWEENRELGDFEIAKKSEKFAEWQQNNPGESSKPIPLKDMLAAMSLDNLLTEIEAAAAEEQAAGQLFKVVR
jgi:uncharacterized phage-associated protein